MEHDHHPFFVLSGTLEDFAIFCAIIRNEQPDEAKLRATIATLKKSTTALTAAEQAVPPVPKP